jgi:predicted DsbA family dithiol-disulfide isomerase
LEELFAGRGIDLTASMDRLKIVAAELGLPWGTRTRTFNSRRAQELGKWAESLNRGHAFHLAVFQAYFVHGHNIGKISALAELAESVGLDGRRAEEVLAEGNFRGVVDRDWAYSRTCRITAVPTFLANKRMVVGAQPYEALEELVRAAGATLIRA